MTIENTVIIENEVLLTAQDGLTGTSVPRHKRVLKRPNTISLEQEKKILELNRAGHLKTGISRQLGIPPTTIGRVLDYLSQDPNNGIIDFETKQRELDNKILELNQKGLKSTTIAKMLGTNKKRVLCRLKFLSQDHDNNVVDNSKGDVEDGKWYQTILYIKDVLLPYYRSKGIQPSLRTIFYRLVADGKIEKSETAASTLTQYTAAARRGDKNRLTEELKLPKLPEGCFADETRKLIDNYSDYEPEAPEDAQDPQEYIREKIQELIEAPNDWDYEGRRGKRGGHWYNQPEYVEVWIEKFALAPTFESMLKHRYVNIVVNRGYSSLSFLWNNCQRIKEKIDMFGNDHVHILYFGDWDPSGEDMDRNYVKYFELWNIPPDIFERVAVTLEQIEEYNIPTRPVKTKPREGKKVAEQKHSNRDMAIWLRS